MVLITIWLFMAVEYGVLFRVCQERIYSQFKPGLWGKAILARPRPVLVPKFEETRLWLPDIFHSGESCYETTSEQNSTFEKSHFNGVHTFRQLDCWNIHQFKYSGGAFWRWHWTYPGIGSNLKDWNDFQFRRLSIKEPMSYFLSR